MNTNEKLTKAVQGLLLILCAGSLMGNQGCEGQPPEVKRELRRRVHVGKITAPPITLPAVAGGGSFDFEFVANSQLYRALRETQSFSNASVTGSGFFDPGSVKPGDKDEFYKCDAAEPFVLSNEAICMINMPLARVHGEIKSFQMTGGFNGGLGAIAQLTSAEFKYDHGKLDMEFHAIDPMVSNYHHADTKSTEGWDSYEANADLSFNVFDLTLGGYYKTSMADTVEKAMFKGFTALKKQWDAKNDWYAMVLKSCDNGILINAGDAGDAGLKKGDIVRVHRVLYNWEGAICDSKLKDSMLAPGMDALAYYRIEDEPGLTTTYAVQIKNDPQYPVVDGRIKPGDRVYIEKFAP